MKAIGNLEAAGFMVRRGRQQTMLYHEGQKIGGWNTRDGHWYVSKVAARNREELLLRHGFRWREKKGHEWWQLQGNESGSAFVAVVKELTGIRVGTSD